MIALSDIVAPLFVPGHRPERFAKAAASGADAIIIDLEDAVPPDAKDRARAELRADFDIPVIVRINAAGTPWHAADVEAVAALGGAGLMLPKSEANDDLSSLLTHACRIPILVLIETARGIADGRRIAAMKGVAGLVFGSIDYSADLGCAHSREALLSARSELVLASRLAGKPAPIDGVTTVLNDDEVAEDDARYARDLGFGGKLCIHPRQIGPILSGFEPQEVEIAWARKVLASGSGAVAVDGVMVDEPVRIRARAIMARRARRKG